MSYPEGVAKSGSADGLAKIAKIRRSLFPIYGRQEVTKFLLIGSIKFFIILALTLTRDTKGKCVVLELHLDERRLSKGEALLCYRGF
jgi:AAA family ATP:ADP antiporter